MGSTCFLNSSSSIQKEIPEHLLLLSSLLSLCVRGWLLLGVIVVIVVATGMPMTLTTVFTQRCSKQIL